MAGLGGPATEPAQPKPIWKLVGEYANIVGPHGPDSEKAHEFKAEHAGNEELIRLATSLDLIKRNLGKSQK